MISRRALLAGFSGALAAASCRRSPYQLADFARPARSAVGLFPATAYDDGLADLIFRGLQTLDVRVQGLRVLLKPNMVEYEAGTIINTHPDVVAGAALAMLRAGAREVIVGEAPGHRRDFEYLVVSTGLYDRARALKLPLVDLNHDDVRMVKLKSRFMGISELALPAELLQADFVVSMPKLKTHHWTVMTASMKNLFGVVPGAVYGWPKNLLHMQGIENSILDLAATVRPHFAIVDAIVGMEGDGPIMGTPRPLGFVAMGRDPVAVDATCARVIGLAPEKIGYLSVASAFLGNVAVDRIEQRGENPARYATTFQIPGAFKDVRLSVGG